MTNLTYRAWRESSGTLDGLAAWSPERVALAGRQQAARILIADITPTLFPLLQATPLLGRVFAAGDDEPGRTPTVVLSYGLWQQQFGGRADAIGQSLRLDATTYTIVGVMPAAFAFPDRETRAWVPFYVEPVTTPGRGGFSISLFQAIGRLREGVTPPQAAAEATARGRSVPDPGVVSMAVFGSNGPVNVTVVPMLRGAHRRREAGDSRAVRRRPAAARDGDGQRRQPAAGADDGASPRDGDSVRAGCGPRAARAADAGRERAARAARRRRGSRAGRDHAPRAAGDAALWLSTSRRPGARLAHSGVRRRDLDRRRRSAAACCRRCRSRGPTSSRRSPRIRWRRSAADCERGRPASAR